MNLRLRLTLMRKRRHYARRRVSLVFFSKRGSLWAERGHCRHKKATDMAKVRAAIKIMRMR
jgi:hypothetical protein